MRIEQNYTQIRSSCSHPELLMQLKESKPKYVASITGFLPASMLEQGDGLAGTDFVRDQ